MFLPQGQGFTWTFNPESKGRLKGRVNVVRAGYFVLEHKATGKLFIGQAKDCSLEVDTNLQALHEGRHPSRAFLRLYESDPELAVHEFPSATVKEAKRVAGLLRCTVTPAYLTIN